MMSNAVKMEVSPETIIRAVKGMRKSVRQASWKISSRRPPLSTLQSIREARRDVKAGRVKSHGEVFGR